MGNKEKQDIDIQKPKLLTLGRSPCDLHATVPANPGTINRFQQQLPVLGGSSVGYIPSYKWDK